MLTKNIQLIRTMKGYSQEYMAKQLEIAQNTYSRIESNEIAIGNERLLKVSKVLDLDIEKIADFDSNLTLNIEKQENNDSAIDIVHRNYTSKNEKELYDKLLAEKDKIIQLLEEQIAKD